MPSQEEIRICEPVDNLNHIFSYDNDLKSQLHRPLCHQNGLTKQPSTQLNKGSTRTDNSSSRKNTHQLNSEAVCMIRSCGFKWWKCGWKQNRNQTPKLNSNREKKNKHHTHIIHHFTCELICEVFFMCNKKDCQIKYSWLSVFVTNWDFYRFFLVLLIKHFIISKRFQFPFFWFSQMKMFKCSITWLFWSGNREKTNDLLMEYFHCSEFTGKWKNYRKWHNR